MEPRKEPTQDLHAFLDPGIVCIPILRWTEGTVVCRVRSTTKAPGLRVTCEQAAATEQQSQQQCSASFALDTVLYIDLCLRLFTVMQRAAAHLGYQRSPLDAFGNLHFESSGFVLMYAALPNVEILAIRIDNEEFTVSRVYGDTTERISSPAQSGPKGAKQGMVILRGNEALGQKLLAELLSRCAKRVAGTLTLVRRGSELEARDKQERAATFQFVQTLPNRSALGAVSTSFSNNHGDLATVIQDLHAGTTRRSSNPPQDGTRRSPVISPSSRTPHITT